TALFALGKWRARQLAESFPQKGAAVVRLLEQAPEALATIVLGNTLANGALVTLALWPALHGLWSAALSLTAVLVLILVGCEVVPKTLAVRAPEQWALRIAPPMRFLQGVTGWFQRLVQEFNGWILHVLLPKSIQPQTTPTEEEYQELLEMAYQQG